MYDSGISRSRLTAEAREGCDVLPALSDDALARRINEIEQFAYSSVLIDARTAALTVVGGVACLSDIAVGEGERAVECGDIMSVRMDGDELRRVAPEHSDIYRTASSLSYSAAGSDKIKIIPSPSGDEGGTVTVVYRASPKLRGGDEDGNVMLPPAHIGMVIDRLRADIYAAVGDDSASLYTDRYNAALRDFVALKGEGVRG